MFSKEQIEKGLELAAQWFEKIDYLGADQLLECVEKANL